MTTRFIYATDPVAGTNPNGSSPREEQLTGYVTTANVSGPMMSVKAAAALVEGQLVYLTTNVTTGVVTAALATTALVTSNGLTKLGIVSKPIASGEFGWIYPGPFNDVEVLTTAGIAAGAQLTTHTVPGTVSTGGTAIPGLTGIETSVAGLTQCRATQDLRAN